MLLPQFILLLALYTGNLVTSASSLDLSIKAAARHLDINPSATTCADANVPPCAVRHARDLLFLVDASNSMDPNHFFGEMLDYTQLLFCAFNSADANQAGMIIFAQTIKVFIPLGVYSQTTWFNNVNTVRALQNTPQTPCCTCCTPHAEAFQAAKNEFARHGTPGNLKIAFVITDGTPYQNSYGIWRWPTVPAGVYAYQTVPQQADLLKADGIRLLLVGVPNKAGRGPALNYFAGIPDPTKVPPGGAPNMQCELRTPTSKPECALMNSPPFPIVSQPVADNLFGTTAWNLQAMLSQTVTSMCKIEPTDSPTHQPSSGAPTNKPTHPAPTTRNPTQRPTKPPTPGPSLAPVKPHMTHLDLYILMDRSRSIRWDAPFCVNAPGAVPGTPHDLVCWHLFLGFARNLGTRMATLGDATNPIGWAGDNKDPTKGLRVTIMGFACANDQTTPLVINIGQHLDTAASFNAALDAAMTNTLPDGGTCPGEAIERIVADVQFSLNRPFKSVVLLTDGIFYDQPRPQEAALGLAYFGVQRFALGIAIPYPKSPDGLTAKQRKNQIVQLTSFVGGDTTHLFNFAEEGYNLLGQVVDDIATALPNAWTGNLPVQANPFWCGWTKKKYCQRPQDIANFCTWDDVANKCAYLPRCTKPQNMCGANNIILNPDLCCSWNAQSNTCVGVSGRPADCTTPQWG